MKTVFLKIIKIYQIVLSPERGLLKLITGGKVCRFYPSCSEYGYESIKKHGILKGLIFTLKRLSKCHPLNPGGVDLPR